MSLTPKKTVKLAVLPLILSGLFFVSAAFAQGKPTEIYLFYGLGCPHCEKAGVFLGGLKQKYPSLTVREYEVWGNQQNADLMSSLASAYGKTADGVPAIFIGNDLVVGYGDDATSGASLESKVASCAQYGCDSPILKLRKGSPAAIDQAVGTDAAKTAGKSNGFLSSGIIAAGATIVVFLIAIIFWAVKLAKRRSSDK